MLISYSFLATRIYLNIDVVEVVYNIYVNGVIMKLDPSASLDTKSCLYTPLTLGSASTNINVTVVVVGQPRSGRKRQNFGDWSFQLNEILTFGSGGNSGSNSKSANDATTFRLSFLPITAAVLLLVTLASFW
jgi:hypothetical protein